MRFIIYCRRSSDREDKQVMSIASQEHELKELALRRELKVVRVIKESMSAKEPGRAGFTELLKLIDGKQADGIICWKHDRLSRNPIDYGAVSYRLQKGVIKQIITSERDYNPEDNVLLMAVEAGMANQYIIDLSRNVKRGLKTKVQMGWMPNKPPCGWVYDKNTKTIVKDEYNFPKVQELLKLALTGKYIPRELQDIANDKLCIRYRAKGKLLTTRIGKNYILATLRNPFHTGIITFKGERLPGAHEPMITDSEHQRLLLLYGNNRTEGPMVKNQERRKKYEYKLSGLIRCPCGRQVSPWRIRNRPGGKEYLYYSCSSRFNGKQYRCGQPIVLARVLEVAIRDELSRVQIDSGMLEWIRNNIGTTQEGEEKKLHEQIRSLQQRKGQLIASKKRLLDHLLNESVSTTAYQEKDDELREEIGSVEREILATHLQAEQIKQDTAAAMTIADKLVTIFDGDDFPRVKQMFRSVFENVLLDGGEVKTVLKRPFQTIRSAKGS